MDHIKLLESSIPTATATATATPSQKAHFDNISGTKRGTINPLVSKRPEKNLNKKIQNSKKICQKWSKMVKNGQNGQNMAGLTFSGPDVLA